MNDKHRIICLDVKYDRMLDACTLDPYDALPQLDRKDPYSHQLYEYIGRKCELLNYDFYDPPREDKEDELMRLKTKSFLDGFVRGFQRGAQAEITERDGAGSYKYIVDIGKYRIIFIKPFKTLKIW